MRTNSEGRWPDEFVDDAATRRLPAAPETACPSARLVDLQCHLSPELKDDASESATRRFVPGQWEKAIAHYKEQLEEVRQAKDRRGEASILLSLASAHLQLGCRQQAIPFLESAMQLGQDVGDPQIVRLANIRLSELRRDCSQQPT